MSQCPTIELWYHDYYMWLDGSCMKEIEQNCTCRGMSTGGPDVAIEGLAGIIVVIIFLVLLRRVCG